LRNMDAYKRLRYKFHLHKGKAMPLPLLEKYIIEVDTQAAGQYTPQIYPGEMTLFWASKELETVYYDPQEEWSRMASGGIKSYVFHGDHKSIFQPPEVQFLADRLTRILEKESRDEPTDSPAVVLYASDPGSHVA
jgi:hypothetical protein